MLKIFENFFNELRNENITFCNWKGNGNLEIQLSGGGDIDIFVPLKDKKRFEKIAKYKGFRQFISYQANHPFLEHYYGFDPESLKFAHLHVYFKIITGEHISKNYILPLDNYLTENINLKSLLPTLNDDAKLNIFLVRFFLKIGSFFGIVQYLREKKKFSLDWDNIDNHKVTRGLPELGLSEKFLNEMRNSYKNSNLFGKFFQSLKLKKKLKNYQRRSFIKNFIFTLTNICIRVVNKFFLKKKKLLAAGFVIAICGMDATGKSSLVNSLKENFSENFSVRKLHLGKPSSSLLTFMINPLFFVLGKVKRLLKNSYDKSKISIDKRLSILHIFRALLLAYDRKKESTRAHKLAKKGFIVICDRYPGIIEGNMDSPRIIDSKKGGYFYQLFYRIEKKFYNSIKPAQIVFQLYVPLEVSLERNKRRNKTFKETDNELQERFRLNKEALFLGESYFFIDATPPFEIVSSQVSELIWQFNI